MNKLLKLRQWLTLSEAARSLSTLVGEEVTAADLLRLAIDRQLTLSVHFVNGVYLRQWIAVDMSSVKWTEVPSPDGEGVERYVEGGTVHAMEDGSTMQLTGPVFRLMPGVADLLMIDSADTEIECEYQRRTGGPLPTTQLWNGLTIKTSDGDLFQVQASRGDSEGRETSSPTWPLFEPQEFLPARSLPEGAVFVVRTESLTALQSKLAAPEVKSDGASEKMPPRVEATYLTIIGALVELIRTPRTGRDSDAAVIRELIDNYSDKPGISKTTLEAKFAGARRQLNST